MMIQLNHQNKYLLSTDRFNNSLQSRFVDGKTTTVPSSNLLLSKVYYGNLDVRAVCGDDSHGGTTDITGTHAANLQLVIRLQEEK